MTEQEKQEMTELVKQIIKDHKIIPTFLQTEQEDCAVINFAKRNPGQAICLYCTCKKCNPWC